MKIEGMSMIKKYSIIISILLLALTCSAQPYPPEKYDNLIPFEIGKGIIEDLSFFKFYYENTYTDKTITTSGYIEINPKYKIDALLIQYVLVDKDMNIVRVVDLFDSVTSENSQFFSATYPYNPDYEFCAFHVKAFAEPDERGTKQNV
jgi:hypothetical protein